MRNMSKVSNWLYVAAASLAVISCGGSDNKDDASGVSKATLEGTLPTSEVVLAVYDSNMTLIADTLKTDDNAFKFDFTITKGHPEFVYVLCGDDVVVPVLLQAGDNVKVDVDADGKVKLEGSEESLKLLESQNEYNAVSAKLDSLASELVSASGSKYSALVSEMSQLYVAYSRAANKYVMENSRSLTVIPVLYRTLPVGAQMVPVIAQDAAPYLYKQIADSLAARYPRSRYVKALRDASDEIFNQHELQKLVDNAEVAGYFDIELPGLDGKMKKLSDLDSKVVLLYFWTAADPQQNIFNGDVLRKIYNDYHHKGFDIFQVSLDTDKVMWATTVMGQNLPWMNVCDIRGAASEYASLYNLQALPSMFIISNGELVDGQAVDEASFRKLLNDLLK